MNEPQLFARASLDDRWEVMRIPVWPRAGPGRVVDAGTFETEEAAQAWIAGYLVADEEWREFGVLAESEAQEDA